MTAFDLVIRGGAIAGGVPSDIAIRDGMIVTKIGAAGCSGREFDASGMTVLPGLIDHHIHILASAAKRSSCDLTGILREDEAIVALRAFARSKPMGSAVRAVGFDETEIGLPDAARLSQWLPEHPLRIQDRTGAVWLLNYAMLERLGSGPFPEGVERGVTGRPTGRIWRSDRWLREKLGAQLPDVERLARELASLGIVGVTDTSPENGPDQSALFEQMIERGDWPLRLQLMGNEHLPRSDSYQRGPLKLHYDGHHLPALDDLVARITVARQQERHIAAHCVTAEELAWYIAALDASGGAVVGDRVEHGSMISADMIAEIARRELTVVSQPAFIHARGDRYLATIKDTGDLYRLESLRRAGVVLAAGSDAPYGPLDPWLAMRCARERRTASGKQVAKVEGLAARLALEMFLRPLNPSPSVRQLVPGQRADCIVLKGSWDDILNEPDAARVVATFVAGKPVYERTA